MRRGIAAAFFAILLFMGRIASADSLAIGDTLHVLNPGGAIYGGVFQVDDLNLPDPIDLLTFCIQLEQDINTDDLFIVGNISTVADDNSGDDPLDDRTAWIYTQYRAGLLGAYTENEIQSAIWVIENEWTFAQENILFPGMEPTLQNQATALIAASQAAVDGGFVNGDVRILNLFFIDGSKAQDLLMLGGGVTTQATPEPATFLLVGSAATALIRRRLKSRKS